MSERLKGWYSRGYLPHFDGGEIPQMITFRLHDSIPAVLLQQWEEELRLLPPERLNTELRRRIEDQLDRGTGEAILARPAIAQIVENALLHFDGERYRLHAWVIMPTHVHVLITPHEDHSLPDILHSWKSFSAQQINRVLRRRGHVWHRDCFDRFIRSARHFYAAVGYIELNPVKANLCAQREDWTFSSATEGAQHHPGG